MKDIETFRKNKIQTKKAKKIFRKKYGENSCIFSDLFLGIIESMVSQYRNFDLFQYILTKENDKNEKFKNMLRISSANIDLVFKAYDIGKIPKLCEMVQDPGLICERTTAAVKALKEAKKLEFQNNIQEN